MASQTGSTRHRLEDSEQLTIHLFLVPESALIRVPNRHAPTWTPTSRRQFRGRSPQAPLQRGATAACCSRPSRERRGTAPTWGQRICQEQQPLGSPDNREPRPPIRAGPTPGRWSALLLHCSSHPPIPPLGSWNITQALRNGWRNE